jgi:hypothetical protein
MARSEQFYADFTFKTSNFSDSMVILTWQHINNTNFCQSKTPHRDQVPIKTSCQNTYPVAPVIHHIYTLIPLHVDGLIHH